MNSGGDIVSKFGDRRVQNAIGLVLTLVAIISLVFSWRASAQERKSNDQLKAYVQCQADWTGFLLGAITESRSASAETSQALDDLINSIASSQSAQQTRAALARYQSARAQQSNSQKKNPLPPPPEQICQLEKS